MIPGEIFVKDGEIVCNQGRKTVRLTVVNTGDRPIQVGSHFHFFEVNKAMQFDRELAFGMRLNIISSTAVRFEPGEEKEVELVAFGGLQRTIGFNNLVDGSSGDIADRKSALYQSGLRGFKNVR